MPIYEYECTSCGERSEVLQRMSDPPPDGCGTCGGPLKRLLSAPSFRFKGTGWYVTDYADKKKSDSKASRSGKGSSDSASGAKTDSAPSSGDKSPGDKGGSSDKVSKSGNKPASSSGVG